MKRDKKEKQRERERETGTLFVCMRETTASIDKVHGRIQQTNAAALHGGPGQ